MPLVQANSALGTSGTATAAGAFASAVNAGDLIVGFAGAFNASPVSLSSLVDTLGNSYTPILGPINITDCQIWMLAAYSAIGGSAPTITATYSANVSFPLVGWAEFSGGYSLLDASASATGSGTAYSVSLTTTKANDICVAFFGNTSSAAITMGPESIQLFNPTLIWMAEYLTAGAAGMQTQTASSTSTTWAAIMAAFKTASPGPPAASAAFPLPVYKAIGIF